MILRQIRGVDPRVRAQLPGFPVHSETHRSGSAGTEQQLTGGQRLRKAFGTEWMHARYARDDGENARRR